MALTIPNVLTLLRIIFIPILFMIFWLPVSWAGPACGYIFGLAAVTDWFDGYLARKLNQYSRFGAFLDPVADKLMVASALILIVSAHASVWMVAAATVIIAREIVISALREWMAEMGKRGHVAVSMLGKVKTTFQMFAIAFLLYGEGNRFLGLPLFEIGFVLLQIAAILTIISMILYLKAAWPHMTDEEAAQ